MLKIFTVQTERILPTGTGPKSIEDYRHES